ncbi:hypothetical protein AYX14_07039 [Cryptococcus neoformans]|nr:hypothetical protein AYX14_07039 [Cryptococcus neoformans var. grubii]
MAEHAGSIISKKWDTLVNGAIGRQAQRYDLPRLSCLEH